MLKKTIAVVITASMLSLYSGCSTVERVSTTLEQQEVLLHAAIVVGVKKLVVERPECKSPLHNAAVVARGAVGSTDVVTTETVVTFIQRSLALSNLSEEDKILLSAGVQILGDEVNLILKKIAPDNNRVLAIRVLTWVIETTK